MENLVGMRLRNGKNLVKMKQQYSFVFFFRKHALWVLVSLKSLAMTKHPVWNCAAGNIFGIQQPWRDPLQPKFRKYRVNLLRHSCAELAVQVLRTVPYAKILEICSKIVKSTRMQFDTIRSSNPADVLLKNLLPHVNHTHCANPKMKIQKKPDETIPPLS